MSDLDFRPNHKTFRITISTVKYAENLNIDKKAQYVFKNAPYKITLLLGLLGYCETNAIL